MRSLSFLGRDPSTGAHQIDSEESRKLTLSREREEEEDRNLAFGASGQQPRRQRLAAECLGARRKPTANFLIQPVVPRALRLPSNSDCRKEGVELGAEEPEPKLLSRPPPIQTCQAVLKIHLGYLLGIDTWAAPPGSSPASLLYFVPCRVGGPRGRSAQAHAAGVPGSAAGDRTCHQLQEQQADGPCSRLFRNTQDFSSF